MFSSQGVNFTTDFIYKYFDELKIDCYEGSALKTFQSKGQTQFKDEYLEIQEYGGLELCEDSKFYMNTEVDPKKMLFLTDTHYHNYDVMNATECALNSYISRYDTVADFAYDLVSNEKQIGEESVNGIVIEADVGDAKDFFVAKISKFVEDGELIHEIFIGIFAINNLRRYIPNFMYTYGGLSCSISFKDDGTPIICKDNGEGKYALLENLKGSIPFRKYTLSGIDTEEFVNIYLQVLLSLQVAYEKYDFTHYDLHDMNVLLRDPPDGKDVIKYPLESGDVHLRVNKVATLIDFGTSHIKINDKSYGKPQNVLCGCFCRPQLPSF